MTITLVLFGFPMVVHYEVIDCLMIILFAYIPRIYGSHTTYYSCRSLANISNYNGCKHYIIHDNF